MSSSSNSALSRLVGGKRLGRARRFLADSLAGCRQERRQEGRISAGPYRYEVLGEGQLLNISDSGLAVRVAHSCKFARGERCLLAFTEGTASYEVQAKVRWTWSTWARSRQALEYYQLAGFSVDRPLSSDTREDLSFLRTMIRDHGLDLSLDSSRVLESCRADVSPTDH